MNIRCYNCGKEIDEGSVFCGYCGKKQPTVKYCVKCGKEIGLDDAFCGYCGTPQVFKEEDAPVVKDEQETQEEHQESHETDIVENSQNVEPEEISEKDL